VPLLDITADDIFKRNQLYVTRAKSFDTFFSFGPYILTPDEIDNLQTVTVSTVLNGQVVRSGSEGNMAFPPDQFISFHSRVFTSEPGDIIATGTPGATVIGGWRYQESRLTGFEPLKNNVQRTK
jgi:2-keto-4-pentenoate hydratase/2-oxohepta-3-ene-1,7-dioic acid hydratase in catechol pathway